MIFDWAAFLENIRHVDIKSVLGSSYASIKKPLSRSEFSQKNKDARNGAGDNMCREEEFGSASNKQKCKEKQDTFSMEYIVGASLKVRTLLSDGVQHFSSPARGNRP
jgi:hypothetical protein